MAEAGGKPPVVGTDEQLLAEHRQIRDLTTQIENCRELPELLGRLRELRAVLAPHFLAEEATDGFYDTLRRASPRQLALVETLLEEHRTFLTETDRVAQRARACLAGPVAAVLAEARALVRRVKTHEAREDNLLLDSLYLDLGHGE